MKNEIVVEYGIANYTPVSDAQAAERLQCLINLLNSMGTEKIFTVPVKIPPDQYFVGRSEREEIDAKENELLRIT